MFGASMKTPLLFLLLEDWSPDLRETGSRITAAMLVKF
jgi:hypothetical protein